MSKWIMSIHLSIRFITLFKSSVFNFDKFTSINLSNTLCKFYVKLPFFKYDNLNINSIYYLKIYLFLPIE